MDQGIGKRQPRSRSILQPQQRQQRQPRQPRSRQPKQRQQHQQNKQRQPRSRSSSSISSVSTKQKYQQRQQHQQHQQLQRQQPQRQQPQHQQPQRQQNFKQMTDKNRRQFVERRVNNVNNVLVKSVKRKYRTSSKYRKFTSRFTNPENKGIIKKLPSILLAISLLAAKNIVLLKSIYNTYTVAEAFFKINNSGGIYEKITHIINMYINTLEKLKGIEKLSIISSVLTLFIEDIPDLWNNFGKEKTISKQGFKVLQQIINNANLIDKELDTKKSKGKSSLKYIDDPMDIDKDNYYV